jgi:hypothetical protein
MLLKLLAVERPGTVPVERIAEVLWAGAPPPWAPSRDEQVAQIKAVRCPVLLVHGSDDLIVPASRSAEIAGLTGGDLLLIDGAGHCPQLRDPVPVNRAMPEFIDRVSPPAERAARRSTWTRARHRAKRVPYVSSPIGLGHARRDLAIAAELRALHDDVQVDWLAQHPVTAAGQRVHPASAFLASESAHVESEAGEHDLHAFQAIRRMDEIMIANFSVLQDVVESGDYDLVVGDESWDLDYFWHENPELKRAAYAWITDFAGDLRMIAVTGPRIDPASLPGYDGLEARGFVPDLHRHLAAADVAIVQGGLTTTMELVAARRPFLYFPLANHFEQQRHVSHRLDRYRAGRRMDYGQTDPGLLAAAIIDEMARPADYLPVAPGGAPRAAAMLAELL